LLLVTERTLVKNLSTLPDGETSVSGWVETVRDQKKVQFVVLRDESGAVQLVHPRLAAPVALEGEAPAEPVVDEVAEIISGLAQGTFLTVHGTLKKDERVKLGGLEIKISSITVAAASTSGWTGASSICAPRATT
jgi:aspartyl/asparaginyl-tRNA synthetase